MNENKECLVLDTIIHKLYEVAEVMDPGIGQQLSSKSISVSEVIELLDWLRTTVKYSKFDIESCRREMRILRKYIDEQNKLRE